MRQNSVARDFCALAVERGKGKAVHVKAWKDP